MTLPVELSRAGANCYIINKADIDKGYIVVPLSQVEEVLKEVAQLDNNTDAMTAFTAAIVSVSPSWQIPAARRAARCVASKNEFNAQC